MKYKEVISKYVKGILGRYSTQKGKEAVASLTGLDGVYLKSYNTTIAIYDGSKFIITSRWYSKTTSKQVNELKRQIEATNQKYIEVFDVCNYVNN